MSTSKSYTFQKGPSNAFPLIGFSLNSERPEVFLPKMERELKKKAFRGAVLIDTLACNGLSSRRFFIGEFDGEHLVYATLKSIPLSMIDTDTQRFCQHFYAQRPDALESSVLTAAQRFKLRRDVSVSI